MAKRISNMDQLAKALQPVMVKMVDELAERVYQTLNYFLQEYYTGWEPSSYRMKDETAVMIARTNKMLKADEEKRKEHEEKMAWYRKQEKVKK